MHPFPLSSAMISLRSGEFCFSFLLLECKGFPFHSLFFLSWWNETEVIQEIKLILLLMPKNVESKQCKEQEIQSAVKWRDAGVF